MSGSVGTRTGSHGTYKIPAAFGRSQSRSILFFSDAGKSEAGPGGLLGLLASTQLSIESRYYEGAKTDGRLLRAWHREERHRSSLSLGLVAAVGSGTDAVRQIMIAGYRGGPLPGAIALLGYDTSLAHKLLKMAGGGANSSISMEWPPVLFILSVGDPLLAECARACRALRATGVQAKLEIVEGDQQLKAGVKAALTDFAAELDRFFGEHLISDFPKLFA